MGERLDITAFPAELKSTLDISDDVKKDEEKALDGEVSDKSSVTGEVYDSGCQSLQMASSKLSQTGH